MNSEYDFNLLYYKHTVIYVQSKFSMLSSIFIRVSNYNLTESTRRMSNICKKSEKEAKLKLYFRFHTHEE